MKIKFIISLFLIGLLFSCGAPSEKKTSGEAKELKEKIKMKEDSLSKNQNQSTFTIDRNELIALLLEYSTKFPNDKYAPECLDKIHMMYSKMELYSKASEFADIILKKYPKYEKRFMILESQASNYDIFIQPRDTNKVRYYNEILLKEFPNMSKEKKEEINMKLKHLDLNFEKYIDYIMKQAK